MIQMESVLDDILQRITGQAEPQRKKLAQEVFEATKSDKWIPNPGPQTDAYFSKADVLLFGGEPGGGGRQRPDVAGGLTDPEGHRDEERGDEQPQGRVREGAKRGAVEDRGEPRRKGQGEQRTPAGEQRC